MTRRLLLITGKLAEQSLARVMAGLAPRDFDYEIHVPGATVAALITTDMLERRLRGLDTLQRREFDRVILPGRCRGDLDRLTERFGVPFERGPEELKDLPEFFGAATLERTLDEYRLRIFAEIVEAPEVGVDAILARAEYFRANGADVIDLGCLPDTPFPHLEDAVRELKAAGFEVSVDSLEADDLLRGGHAGADYVLSLTEKSLWLADEMAATPILIPTSPTNPRSLYRAIDRFAESGRSFFADAILDPVHFGLTESIVRFRNLRARYPDVAIMMGIGNISELTHADTLGQNTLLAGIASELDVAAVLTTEVSGHCRSVVRELDHARRVMWAARQDHVTPRHISERLLALHDRKPHPYSDAEIREFAAAVKDPNFRIQTAADGIYVYNRDGLQLARDPYDFYPDLGVDDDASHAFYLGMELARAQVAWQLGKRYEQDEELEWGCIHQRASDDKRAFKPEKSTLAARRARRRRGR